MASRRPARWPTVAAFAAALIALGVGAVGWFRPAPLTYRPPAPSVPIYTEQQIADAKADVCAAYSLSKNEVAENTHRPDLTGDEIGSLASAAMKRIAVHAAGDYLLERLRAEPATPIDLADSIRSLANTYEEFAMRALNGEPDSALDPLRRAADADITKIDGLCK